MQNYKISQVILESENIWLILRTWRFSAAVNFIYEIQWQETYQLIVFEVELMKVWTVTSTAV